MIRRKLLTLVALAFSMCASAQFVTVDDEQQGTVKVLNVNKSYVLSLGPKIGANYSFASDPDGVNLGIGGAVGFSGGIAANIRFARPVGKPVGTERFGVQVEALYSMHTLSTDTEDIKMSTFEVPVLFQWYVFPSVCLQVGPTFTGAFSVSPDYYEGMTGTLKTGDVKANDIMLTVGAGYKHKSGFTADVRYNLGNSDLAENLKSKVSTLSLSFGWLFTLIK